ncbi:hypothetical protein GCM10020367_19470 [Streptomyces sannanensis]|uniref:DUF5753 domain-containing protein n=1 Tax=Streptomyces sannanensis TaxID=285536 RepID=A0ABP6S8M2_9ACTN
MSLLAAVPALGEIVAAARSPWRERAPVRHLDPQPVRRVLPFMAGEHAGLIGSFTTMRFDDDPDIVYSEDLISGHMTANPRRSRKPYFVTPACRPPLSPWRIRRH